MARYGSSEWGSPFGAFDSETFTGVFDYRGFVDKDGNTSKQYSQIVANKYNSKGGFYVQETGYKDVVTIPYKPVLINPIIGTKISGTIKISWTENNPQDDDLNDVYYEIQWNHSYSQGGEWNTIAKNIPQMTSEYDWDSSIIPHSTDAAIRIRAIDSTGLISDWDVVSGLIVENKAPYAPTVVSPSEFTEFDSYINFIWTMPEELDPSGDNITFTIEYTLPDTDTWITLKDKISQDSRSYEVNIVDLPSTSKYDYSFSIKAIDDLGSSSDRVVVNRIKISHSGELIIDTEAPVGSIQIANGDEAVISREVKINIKASDPISGIYGYKLGNSDSGLANFGEVIPFTDTFWHRLSLGEGFKKVSVSFIDNAGNETEKQFPETFIRVFGNGNSAFGTANIVGRAIVGFSDSSDSTIYDYTVMSSLRKTFEGYLLSFVNDNNGLAYIGLYNGITMKLIVYDNGEYKDLLTASGSGKIVGVASYTTNLFAAVSDGRIFKILEEGTTFFDSDKTILGIYSTNYGLFTAIDEPNKILVYNTTTTNWDLQTVEMI